MNGMLALDGSRRRVRLTLDDYLMLAGAGAFDQYNKTELIDGEVLTLSPQHLRHVRIKSRLFTLIAERIPDLTPAVEALVEVSVAIPPYDAPMPDIAVTSAAEGEGLLPPHRTAVGDRGGGHDARFRSLT